MAQVYKKLVRDNIPDIIRTNGQTPVVRVLAADEFLEALIQKLKEEVSEFAADRSAEELADLEEVMIAIRQALGLSVGELEGVRRAKAAKNGRFTQRLFLEEVR